MVKGQCDADLVLAIERDGEGQYRSLVLEGPAGTRAQAPFDPPFDRAKTVDILRGLGNHVERTQTQDSSVLSQIREVGGPSRYQGIDVRSIGVTLHEALFRGRVRDAYLEALGWLKQQQGGRLRLRLVFGIGGDYPDDVAALPWELLCPPGSQNFLVLGERISVIRELDVPVTRSQVTVDGPLRVLAAISQPHGSDPLSLDREWRGLRHELEADPAIELRALHSASIEELREALLEGRFQALHFMGHGLFNRDDGVGELLFEGDGGQGRAVSGQLLAANLRDLPHLRFTVLNACHSGALAAGTNLDPFLGVASALLLGGQSSVIGMQAAIPDVAAIDFSRGFYRALARGNSIESSLFAGRLRVLNTWGESSAAWAIPTLLMAPGARNMRFQESELPGGGGGTKQLEAVLAVPAAKSSRPSMKLLLVAVGLGLVLVTGMIKGHGGALNGSKLEPGLPRTDQVPPETAIGPVEVPTKESPNPNEPESQAASPAMSLAGGAQLHMGSVSLPGFAEALDRFASGLRLPDAEIYLNLEAPRRSETRRLDERWQTCRVAASGSVEHLGITRKLKRVEAVRAHSDSNTACDNAAEALAKAVVVVLAQTFQGET